MNSSTQSDGPRASSDKKRRYLTAEKKFQIYLEAQASDKPVGEILRREGMFSTDLARIRQQVREGALQRLGAKPGRKVDLVSSESYEASSRTAGKGAGLGRPGGRTGDSAKKNEWGFVGPIAGQWLNEQTKLAILIVIATSQDQGVSARRSCAILAISHRRIVRWQRQVRQGLGLADVTPGPQEPWHRVLPEEIDQIAAMAKSQEYVDLSHRILAVTAGIRACSSRPFPRSTGY